jgi:hypothetical protein
MGARTQNLRRATADAAVKFGFFFLGKLAAMNFEAVFERVK